MTKKAPYVLGGYEIWSRRPQKLKSPGSYWYGGESAAASKQFIKRLIGVVPESDADLIEVELTGKVIKRKAGKK
ncbi:MAG: hypothetical protein U0990_09715 [Candidatus Nanopelagicales bacterium]|nr:hypothetical protein [Candidatus Nanopelagicales bacterium]